MPAYDCCLCSLLVDDTQTIQTSTNLGVRSNRTIPDGAAITILVKGSSITTTAAHEQQPAADAIASAAVQEADAAPEAQSAADILKKVSRVCLLVACVVALFILPFQI